jgi:hypothetical protein
MAADTVVGLTFELDEITTVTFVKHNEAKKMRLTSFGRGHLDSAPGIPSLLPNYILYM